MTGASKKPNPRLDGFVFEDINYFSMYIILSFFFITIYIVRCKKFDLKDTHQVHAYMF